MALDKQTNYLKIGSFVIAGLFLAILVVVLFGAKSWFQKNIYVETYFNESVQGITVGSPVKYLGMDIGIVKKIVPADSIYKIYRPGPANIHDRYVFVLMAIKPKFFRSGSKHMLDRTIAADVAAGLRVKLTLQNVTGSVFLELDFMNPKKNVPMKIYWTPKHYYIPSTPSTMTFFKDQIRKILSQLKQVDFKKLFNSMQALSSSASDVAGKLDNVITRTSNQIVDTVDNLHNFSENLNALTEQTKNFPSYTLFGKPPPKLDLGKL